MLDGLIGGLIAAWILALFDFDKTCIEVIQPFCKTVILTSSHYYFALGLIGLVGGALSRG